MNIFSFRHICLLCHQATLNSYDLCSPCQKNLPIYTETHSFKHSSITTLFNYTFPINHIITQLKFHGKLIYAKLLGQLLAEKILLSYQNKTLPELIIPVPLHKKRLQERGFNQALEIAKPISKILNIKINKSSCIRKKYTAPQSTLSASDRQQNIKNSFAITHDLQVNHIAVLDDVITTGETTRELTETLVKSGVNKIDLWCCAQTVL